MPIYEYQCCECSHQFEIIHGPAGQDGEIRCPKCGNPRVQRMISSFACGGFKESAPPSVSACGPKPRRFS